MKVKSYFYYYILANVRRDGGPTKVDKLSDDDIKWFLRHNPGKYGYSRCQLLDELDRRITQG